MRKRHTEHHITIPSSNVPTLRTSKSYEDLLSRLAAEDADLESPFSSHQRQSFLRRSLNTVSSRSSSGQRDSPARKDLKLVKQKFSTSGLGEQQAEKLSSSSVEVVKKTATVPNNFMDPKFLSPFDDEWAQQKPRSASALNHNVQASTSFSSLGTGGNEEIPSPPSVNQKPSANHKPFLPPPSPLSQSRSKKEVRGHKKSHSLGTK